MFLIVRESVVVDVFIMNSKALVVSGHNPANPVQSYLCPRLWRSQQPRRLKRLPVWLLKLSQKYIFYRNTVGRALLLPSRVSTVEFQSFILKTGAGRAIETICETALCCSKINPLKPELNPICY